MLLALHLLLGAPCQLREFVLGFLLLLRLSLLSLAALNGLVLVLVLVQFELEQVREILHCLLGLRRIGPRQRRDGVHAVEEKMWADAGLQGVDTGARLHLHPDARV